MPRESWRDQARPVIAAAIESGRTAGLEGRELLAHIREAYPFGAREMWPYKVWLSEIKAQLGRHRPGERKRPADLEGQRLLF